MKLTSSVRARTGILVILGLALILPITLMLAATAAIAQQQDLRVNVLIVESVEDFQRWLQQKPTPQGRYPPSLKEAPAGKKIHFPVIVQGLDAPAQGAMTLVADVEFLAPGGKSMAVARQCCKYTVTNGPDIRMAMLGPTMSLELESGDPKGDYTVRVSVTDGSRTATTSETFRFAAAKSATPSPAPAPAAAPKLQMGVPPAKNPGRDMDKRDCLTLPTPSEVIKCTERG